MSVRKVRWATRKGEEREAWQVDYFDGAGIRRAKNFKKKKDAVAHHDKVKAELSAGVHTPPRASITVRQAAADWLKFVEGEKREKATLRGYQVLVEKHILPRIGATKLSSLTTPRVEKLRDDLLDMAKGVVSRRLAGKVLMTIKMILKDAKRRGNVAQNVAVDVQVKISGRDKPKPKVGVDIPTRDEIRRAIEAAREGYDRTFLMTAAFTGLRASELRGLRWQDLDLDHGRLHVRQRADRYNEIGRPKSASGERTVPIGPLVVNTLRQWKLASKHSADENLVFATKTGEPQALNNIVTRVWQPSQVKAGVVDADGKAKYSGLHSLRHFYASWCINRHRDGGLELPVKAVQTRLGHSSIVMTLDRYGHLFPGDDGEELAEAESAIFAT
jgi:integrase